MTALGEMPLTAATIDAVPTVIHNDPETGVHFIISADNLRGSLERVARGVTTPVDELADIARDAKHVR